MQISDTQHNRESSHQTKLPEDYDHLDPVDPSRDADLPARLYLDTDICGRFTNGNMDRIDFRGDESATLHCSTFSTSDETRKTPDLERIEDSIPVVETAETRVANGIIFLYLLSTTRGDLSPIAILPLGQPDPSTSVSRRPDDPVRPPAEYAGLSIITGDFAAHKDRPMIRAAEMSRWRKHGKDRLYFSEPEMEQMDSYIDLKTGEVGGDNQSPIHRSESVDVNGETFKYYFAGRDDQEYVRAIVSEALFESNADIFVSQRHTAEKPGKVLIDGDTYEAKDIIKSMGWDAAHAKFHPRSKCWEIDKDALPELQERLEEAGFSVDFSL